MTNPEKPNTVAKENDNVASGKSVDLEDSNTKGSTTDSLYRLLQMSRPEWPLIGLSACTLGVTSSVTLLFPYASGSVIDYTVSSGADGVSPVVLAGGLLGLSVLSATGVYLRTLWLSRAGNRIVARLKQQLYSSLLHQEAAWLDLQTTGDLLSRLTADAQLVQSALTTQAVAGLRGTVMSTGSAMMLLYTSPTLAAISCATLPPIFILSRHFGRKLSKQQEQVQELLGQSTTLAEQSLSSVTTVQQFVAQDYEANQYRNSIAAAHSKAVDTAYMQAGLEAGVHVGANAAVMIVLGYGGTMVMQGDMTAGDLTGFVMYSFLMAGNMSALTSVYSDLVRSVAASQRIWDILDRTPKIRSHSPESNQYQERTKVIDPLESVDYHEIMSPKEEDAFDGSVGSIASSRPEVSSRLPVVSAPMIEFNRVSFNYPARPDVPVLENLSLTVKPGEIVALVGGSGSGKSTLAHLLTRMYDPNNPRTICLDGVPLAEWDLHKLRHMVAVVSQDPVLFRGTIRDNIRYGEWDHVTEDDIQRVARQANVLDFVQYFPDGLDTMVGPRGMQLSGGQRQRIALARALAKNAPILILDEATSALDAQSEHLVQKALEKLFEDNSGRTILSVAHRLSTIRHASRIAVVQEGGIVQTGDFESLRSSDGPFRELMKTQLVGDAHH
eukprot:Nitzschia sp. Nitz4//scaffold22_size323478//202295//204295//NITZ4_000556-RA/size323478-processed-gene-0.106-mRNA-1//-1//CDS//3329543082//874//frame0